MINNIFGGDLLFRLSGEARAVAKTLSFAQLCARMQLRFLLDPAERVKALANRYIPLRLFAQFRRGMHMS